MVAIQIVNQSTVVTDAELAKIADALQIQVNRDFAPAWNHAGALVKLVAKEGQVDSKAWPVYVMDHSPEPGALGFHEDLGQPLGRVFAADDKKYGEHLSVTLSHEVLELLLDPLCTFAAYRTADNRLYCLENADAVQADELGYEIDGVLVSDFVLSGWFADGGGPYDFRQHCAKPFEILRGGYIGFMDLANIESGWQDLTTDAENIAEKKRVGSRYWRRRQLYARIQR